VNTKKFQLIISKMQHSSLLQKINHFFKYPQKHVRTDFYRKTKGNNIPQINANAILVVFASDQKIKKFFFVTKCVN
jgi:hypothetical protein